jgi:hypothetical protein
MGSADKRKAPRFTMNQIVELNFGKEEFVEASGLNISEMGIMCQTSRALDECERLFLMFSLDCPDCSNTIKCEGIVVHCNKIDRYFIIGIEFSDLKPEDREIIKNYSRYSKH